MTWDSFKTYGLGHRDAFETLNNQLFERYIRRTHAADLHKFRVISGNGGVEAYATLTNGETIAIQSKWFRTAMDPGQIAQVKSSILTAKNVRHSIKEYIICIPHDVHSVKIGRGKNRSTLTNIIDLIGKSFPEKLKKVQPSRYCTFLSQP